MSIRIAELRLLDAVPPVLDETSPDTTVWLDGDNGAVAFSATRGAWHWFRITGAGSYRFPVSDAGSIFECGVVPEGGASSAILVDSYYRSVVPRALQAYGFEALHGSAVAVNGGVVALCAQRETGKSTIAFALQQRGHEAVADDAVVMTVPGLDEDRPVEVLPLPFALRLREQSAKHFEAPAKRRVLVDSHSHRAGEQRLPLSAIVMLARHDGPVTLERVAGDQAFSLALSQSHAFSMEHGQRKKSMVGNYMRLVRLVPTFRLSFPSGLDHLGAICETIEGLVGARSTVP